METHPAKRVEIIVEAVMERRLSAAIEEAGVTGWTVLPVLGGSGRSGRWSREGQVGRTGLVMLVVIVREEAVEALLDAAFKVVERHIGLVDVSDCRVVRAERF